MGELKTEQNGDTIQDLAMAGVATTLWSGGKGGAEFSPIL